MIINREKKNDKIALDNDALDKVSGGLIIPAEGVKSPEFIPDTVIDDRTLNVIGQTDSTEAAVIMAQTWR